MEEKEKEISVEKEPEKKLGKIQRLILNGLLIFLVSFGATYSIGLLCLIVFFEPILEVLGNMK